MFELLFRVFLGLFAFNLTMELLYCYEAVRSPAQLHTEYLQSGEVLLHASVRSVLKNEKELATEVASSFSTYCCIYSSIR